jgi:asparagine synthase (glutamine-hydrolysing)
LLEQAGAPPLDTFSALDSDPDCLESRGIRASLALPHIAPHLVTLGEEDSLRDEVMRLTRDSIEPFDAHMVMIRAIYLAAQRDGIRVMLDGVGGDTSLPTGDMIAFHLGHGRVRKAWHEARAQERFWHGKIKAGDDFRKALKRLLVPSGLRALRADRWERAKAVEAAAESPLNPAFAARIDMVARRRRHYRNVRVDHDCTPENQALRMLHPHITVARERYDRVASVHGIEPRDPFLDTRVLEFCLSLPVAQLHDDGWPKLVLRRLMVGVLPDSVLWKTGRDHVGWRFIDQYAPGPVDGSKANTLAELDNYIDRPGLERDNALRCSTKGLVREMYLDYLGNWIRRLHSLQE